MDAPPVSSDEPDPNEVSGTGRSVERSTTLGIGSLIAVGCVGGTVLLILLGLLLVIVVR